MTLPVEPQIVSSEATSDEAIVESLRKGNAEAAAELVSRYYQPLLRYLQRLTGSQMAEELLQQTWLSVLDHAEKFSSESSKGGFKAWVFRIATNKANDHWRAKGREKSVRDSLRLIGAGEALAADSALEGYDETQKLRWAIAQLPENQRQVVLLRYYSELKFTEIADILGCPLNTALGRMHKAMIKLKALMDD